jgi:hypothetical protein
MFALAHYTLVEMLDIFSLLAIEQLSVTPTNSRLVVHPIANSPPHRTRHDPPLMGSSRDLLAVVRRTNLSMCNLRNYFDTLWPECVK